MVVGVAKAQTATKTTTGTLLLYLANDTRECHHPHIMKVRPLSFFHGCYSAQNITSDKSRISIRARCELLRRAQVRGIEELANHIFATLRRFKRRGPRVDARVALVGPDARHRLL